MSGSIPYLGSKISLISKSEIRYEGILYTIDAQESIIALAKVRSFGTEDRPTEMPVPARDEVYEYIIFRGTDIKTIEVCDTPKVSSLHNDPAIVQHSAPTVVSVGPASTGSSGGSASFQQSSFHRQSLGPIGGAIGGGISQNMPYSSGGSSFVGAQPLQQQSSIIQPSFMSSSSQPNILADVLSGSRSSTPALRKSPVSDAGVAVSPPTIQSPAERKTIPLPQRQTNSHERPMREGFSQRRPVSNDHQYNRDNQSYNPREFQGYNRDFQRNDGRDYRDHQRDFRDKIRTDHRDYNNDHRLDGRDFRDQRLDGREHHNRVDGRDYYREGGQRDNQRFSRENYQGYRDNNHPGNYSNRGGGYFQGGYQSGYYPQQMHMMNHGGRMNRRPNPGRGARGSFGGTRGGKQDTTQYDKEFDFEQANEEFEELRTQLAKAKISDKVSEDGDVKDVEHKDDSGHETAPGEDSEDSASSNCYDKTKSFFDSISCEAIERSKGRSQRPDWRQERKINVQTFGVATARRGFFQRGRGGYYRGGYYNNRNTFGNQGYYNNRGGGQGYRGGSRGGSSNANSISNGPSEPSGENVVPASTYASTVRNSAATETAAN